MDAEEATVAETSPTDTPRTWHRFLDDNVRYLKWPFYAVIFGGALQLSRHVYLLRKFTSTRQLPDYFIKNHIRLNGSVVSVKDNVLGVDHHPILALQEKPKDAALLPVSLAGVSITEAGEGWLKNTLIGNTVWFTPIYIDKGDVIVSAVKYRKYYFWRPSVNRSLVVRGLAKLDADMDRFSDPVYSRLVSDLLRAEVRAERKGRGVWKPPTLTERAQAASAAVGEKVTGSVTSLGQKVTGGISGTWRRVTGRR